MASRATMAAGTGLVAIAGMTIPIVPVSAGALACLLVRIPLIKGKTLLPELCLTGLAVMGTCLTIIDHRLAPGTSFWTGVGFGGFASTIIEAGKSAAFDALKGRLQAAAGVLFGLKGGTDE